jgi:tryptophan-rich sensory protein
MQQRAHSRPVLVAFLVGCQLVGILGAWLFSTGDSPWYAALEKPAFQPPGWLFGPVWTILYVLMAVAAWRVWRLPASRARTTALFLFGVQLFLNGIWTPVFFGAQAPLPGLVVLAALWGTLAATTWAFRRLDKPASRMLLPYVAWTTFALLLNASIVALN